MLPRSVIEESEDHGAAAMTRSVKLIGLDFGTTTSSAVVASAELAHNAVTGRAELSQVYECYRSDMVFTPLLGEALDLDRLGQYLDEWLAKGRVMKDELLGGGAILTGLTAQKANADALTRLINQLLGEALVATANDPCFESWLAFMGSCAGLSRDHPQRPIINLDIGGGTTNIALGRGGNVVRTGCLLVGARHVQVVPGTYQIVRLSRYASRLFEHIEIRKSAGESLTADEVDRVLDFYVMLICAAVRGDVEVFRDPVARLHQQVEFQAPVELVRDDCDCVLTLSGGVGELVYAHLRGRPLPTTTFYGDLGIDLAQRLIAVPEWVDHLRSQVPAGGGRATVYGLLRHATQVSGSTLFLPNPDVLPIRNMPIFGSISPASTDSEIQACLELTARNPSGGCLLVKLGSGNDSAVKTLGERLATRLDRCGFPADLPLVLVTDRNVGKALGHCVTAWGRVPVNLMVVDEIDVRDAQFVQVGRMRNQVVPVSLFGVRESHPIRSYGDGGAQ